MAFADYAHYRLETPIAGIINEHYFSGGPKVVRSGNIVWATARNNSYDSLYRSVDGGQTWTRIYQASSTIAAGKTALLRNGNDPADVFWIYHSGQVVYRRRFPINDTTVSSATFNGIYPAVQLVNAADFGETNTGNYKSLCATIDADGDLYVFCVHETISPARSDDIWCLHSDDRGDTWDAPVAVSGALADLTWFIPMASVTPDNIVVVAFYAWGGTNVRLATCSDGDGLSWTVRTVTTSEVIYNAVPLPLGNGELYLFAQAASFTGCDAGGLVVNYTDDMGVTWGGWQLVDCTCGYGDPSVALGNDGTVYVSYRDLDPAAGGVSCGDRSRQALAYLPDGGVWTRAIDWFSTDTNPLTSAGYERTATHSQLRYQTHFGGGGPLDLMWIQYESGASNLPTCFYSDPEITIGLPSGGEVYLAAAMAAVTQTPDAALTVSGVLAAAMAAGTLTPDAALRVERMLTALMASGSNTPDAMLLVGPHALSAAMAAATNTPDAALLIVRLLAGLLVAGTLTPDAAISVSRALAAQAAAVSNTPDAVLLSGEVYLAAAMAAVTHTPDATLDLPRALAAAVAAGTLTPDAALRVERALSATAGANTYTRNARLFIAALNMITDTYLKSKTARRTILPA